MENYGIYKNVRKSKNREKYGHLLYFGECSICGKTIEKRLVDFKRENSKCIHNNNRCNIYDKRIKSIYNGMKNRCYNKNCKDYKFYGENGICICKEWFDKPQNFEKWAISNGYKDDLTIDRIDVNLNYCPDNCRWVTALNNARYKSTTRIVCVNGMCLTGRQWANRLNVGINYVNTYIRKHGIEKTKEFIKKILDEDAC